MTDREIESEGRRSEKVQEEAEADGGVELNKEAEAEEETESEEDLNAYASNGPGSRAQIQDLHFLVHSLTASPSGPSSPS